MPNIKTLSIAYLITLLLTIVAGCSDSSQTEPTSVMPQQGQVKSNQSDAYIEQNKSARNQQASFGQPRATNKAVVGSRLGDIPIQGQNGAEAEEEKQRITESIGELAIDPSDDAAREHLSQQLKDADLYRKNMLKQAKSEMAPN